VTFDMPVNGDAPVLSVGVWHRAQPMLLNNAWPFCAEVESGAGIGGDDRRMKMANILVSELALPLSESPGGTGVLSSGVPLNTQPGTAARSLGKFSLETPCSTL